MCIRDSVRAARCPLVAGSARDPRSQRLFERRYKHTVKAPVCERLSSCRHIGVYEWMARAYSRQGLSVAIHLDADILTVKPLITMVPETVAFWAYGLRSTYFVGWTLETLR
eukprot:2176832-Amphidinium_carterae.1